MQEVLKLGLAVCVLKVSRVLLGKEQPCFAGRVVQLSSLEIVDSCTFMSGRETLRKERLPAGHSADVG